MAFLIEGFEGINQRLIANYNKQGINLLYPDAIPSVMGHIIPEE
jgi:hypothetical protein